MDGHADPRFDKVVDMFRRQLDGTDGGAALAVFHRGEPVVDLWGGNRTVDGDPWEADTLAMCFSTTKGAASAALHLQYEAGLVDYDERVSTYWPEFAQNGKQDVTVRQVLCHEAGLHRIRSVIDSADEMLDWDHMVAKLAAERPAYQPGTRNGYHALTYGWLVGEIVQRVTGRPLAEVIASDLAAPLGQDGLYLGCPPEQRHRVAPLTPMRLPGPSVSEGVHRLRMGMVEGVGRALSLAGSPLSIRRTMNALAPRGMEDVVAGAEIMDASIPAANGFFTARALATMYAVYAGNGALGDVRLFSPETVRRIAAVQNRRPDLVLVMPMQWRLGYHRVFGAPDGFGHFGFGGSGAWADPSRDLSVAMVCNRGSGTPIGDARLIRLSRGVIEAVDDAA